MTAMETLVNLECTNEGVPIWDVSGRELWTMIVKRTHQIDKNGSIELIDSPIDLADTYHDKPGVSSIRKPSQLFSSKPGTDVVLLGHAYPRGNASFVDVSLAVGSVRKTVRAFGLRAFRRGGLTGVVPGPALALRDPVALTYENAFGGQDLTDPQRPIGEPLNYVGKGVCREPRTLIDQPANQLEYPEHPTGTGRNVPAAFNPIHRHWQPRASFAGTYDDRWMEQRMPLLPLDFDDRFHVCVPEDQFSATPLRGDEQFEIRNATPDGMWTFSLPRVAIGFSCVILGKRQELRTHLDTIVVDADERTVELTWRAAFPIPKKWEMVDHVIVFEKEIV